MKCFIIGILFVAFLFPSFVFAARYECTGIMQNVNVFPGQLGEFEPCTAVVRYYPLFFLMAMSVNDERFCRMIVLPSGIAIGTCGIFKVSGSFNYLTVQGDSGQGYLISLECTR